MSYQERILKKTNFYLKKYKSNTRRYPSYSIYTRWIEQGKFPEFPFRVVENMVQGGSSITGGNLVPQITLSKKRRGANLAGVLALKNSLKMQTGREPTVDQIAVMIAVYAVLYLKAPQKPDPPTPPAKEVPSPPAKEVPSPPAKEEVIVMPELGEDDDWESLC